MMKSFRRALVALALLMCASDDTHAFTHKGNSSAVAPPSTVFPITYYAGFSGWLLPSTSFPTVIWLEQDPTATSGYANSGTFPTLAKGAAAQGYNLFLGLAGAGGPNWWPENINSDSGEMAAIKAANVVGPMGLIGGAVVDYLHSSGVTNSAQSMRATASGASATANFWAYNLGDEPACSLTPAGNGPDIGQYPTAVSDIASIGADSTRMIFGNLGWQYGLQAFTGCDASYVSGLNAISISGMDLYPLINQFSQNAGNGSDFAALSTGVDNSGNDFLWEQGVEVLNLLAAAPTHPVWVFVDGQNNALGASATNLFSASAGTVNMGSPNLTIAGLGGGYPAQLYTGLAVGLGVNDTPGPGVFGGSSCIPSGTTILSVGSTTTAVMSKNATCSATGLSDTIYYTGGTGGSGCSITHNLCEPLLNEYRITSSQYYSEVWVSIIHGAYGIEMFQQDTASANFSLGDPSGGAPAATAEANIASINLDLQSIATILQRPRDACTMQSRNTPFHVTSTCTTPNGIILTTGTAAVPGAMMAITPASGGGLYVFEITMRRSSAGATYSTNFGVSYASATATVCRDSRTVYDPTHAKTIGSTIALSGSGVLSDTIGTGGVLNNDDYNMIEYAIRRAC